MNVKARAAVFADPISVTTLERLAMLAPTDAPVLITGETGTGKEIAARHIHERSGRTGPFVAVNCGALTESLAEAELFGHQAGAFTGASQARAGWFEAANEGTLFLDEIGDMPLALQVKLLRVLQEREVVRLGSRKAVPLDIRLVASTNVDLTQAVASGSFRVDLFYRLNVAAVELAPLRARRGDILPLAEHFVGLHTSRLSLQRPALSPEARHALLTYDWPGNIRELENVIHVALLVSGGEVIRAQDLGLASVRAAAPATTPTYTQAANPAYAVDPTHVPGVSPTALEIIAAQLDRLFAAPPPDLHERLEELIITRAFSHADQNQVRTAKLLGVSRNILRTLLKRYGLIRGRLAAVTRPVPRPSQLSSSGNAHRGVESYP